MTNGPIHSAFDALRGREKPNKGPDPKDIPCPDCGQQTWAFKSRPDKDERWRVCPENHRWAFTPKDQKIRRINP